MGYIRENYRAKSERYRDFRWSPGDPRPPLLSGSDIRALEDTSWKWEPIPEGTRFGSLTVIGYAFYISKRERWYGWQPYCVCDCGGEGCVIKCNLLSGKTASCDDCAKKKASEKRWWKYKNVMPDDEHRMRLLNRLSAIITRCENPKSRSYYSYGARGIHCYPLWIKDRTEFLRYIQTIRGWDDPTLELDRIDNNLGYEPGNLRFVTRRQNVHNRRRVNVLSARVKELEEENAKLKKELERLRLGQLWSSPALYGKD